MAQGRTIWHRAGLGLALGLWTGGAAAQGGPLICPGCDLSGQDFSGRTLEAPNLAGANLSGANFSDTVISGGNFIGAVLAGATFQDATIQAGPGGVPTLFQNADLSRVDFTDTTITAGDFQYATLTCSAFPGVTLTEAVFGPALGIEPAASCIADFTNTSLSCEFAHRIDAIDTTGADLPDCSVALDDGTVLESVFDEAVALPEESYEATQDGVVAHAMSGTSAFVPPKGTTLRIDAAVAQTVYVSSEGTDAAGCGADISNYCKTIAFGADQCSSADCLVALQYGTYPLTAPVAPGKGGITISGGYVGAKPVGNYQSRVLSPEDGVPAFDLTAKDSGITLQNLLIMGSSPKAPRISAHTIALRATGAALTLDGVNLVAAAGTTGPGVDGGVAGAPGITGSPGTGPSAPGSGGPSSCGAAGGTGGQTVSASASSHLPFPWVECKYSCDVRWRNGGSGQAGGTGTNAAGSSLSKSDSLACYACPSGRGGLPKSAATGSKGGNGSCGTGGAAATDTTGRFDANGVWSGSASEDGTKGLAGGGGGGGGPGGSCGYANCLCSASAYSGGAGGGGGSGGCGATPGRGGQMGAASFGIVLVGAQLTLKGEASVVTGARSGDGSPGGAGQKGGAGSSGGAGKSYSNICNDGGASGAKGGAGGIGGASGGGGGGNSGPSVNIVLTGSGSTVTGTLTQYVGAAGAGGGKGAAGVSDSNCTATDAADGGAGIAEETHTY